MAVSENMDNAVNIGIDRNFHLKPVEFGRGGRVDLLGTSSGTDQGERRIVVVDVNTVHCEALDVLTSGDPPQLKTSEQRRDLDGKSRR